MIRLRKQIHNFLNSSMRSHENKTIRNTYNKYKRMNPGKNAVNAVLDNSYLKTMVAFDKIHVPRPQKFIGTRYKLAAEAANSKTRTRRNRSRKNTI